jgi:hypothetical protein
MSDKERRIRESAYRMWEDEGRPEGQAHRHWATAARRIEAEDLKSAASTPESDASAKQTALATRTVRGKAGSSGSPAGANSRREAPVIAKSRSGDRRPVNNR